MGSGASRRADRDGAPNAQRLLLYSNDAQACRGFEEAVRANAAHTVAAVFSFDTSSSDSFIRLLHKLVKTHTRGRGFESIALATHGPKHPPEAPREG